MNKSDPFRGIHAGSDSVDQADGELVSNASYAEDPVQADHIGALLCATRMRAGGDLQEIARILKIRYGYLVAIEDSRFEDLPGTAYSIGFVRAYADYLGLDGDAVVRRLRDEMSGAVTPTRFEFSVHNVESGLPNGSLLAIAVALGMFVYSGWFVFTNNERTAVDLIQEVPERLAVLIDGASSPDALAMGEGESEAEVEVAAAADPEPAIASQAAAPEPPQAETSSNADAEILPAQTTEEVADQEIALVTGPMVADEVSDPVAVTEAADLENIDSPTEAEVPAPPPAAISEEPVNVDGEAPAASEVASAVVIPDTEAPQSEIAEPVQAIEPEVQVEVSALQAAPDSTPERSVAPAEPEDASPVVADGIEEPASPPTVSDTQTAVADAEATQDDATAEEISEQSASSSEIDPGETESVQVASADDGNLVIELRAKSDSWIQVRDGNDLLLTRLLRKGEVYRVPDREGLTLMTGNAGGLDVFIGGDLAPPLGNEGVVRRGVPLNADSLRAGLTSG